MSRALGERAKAKAAGQTRYFTGVPCPKGHVSERLVSNWTCIACLKIQSRIWNKATPERRAAQNRRTAKSRKATPERRKKFNRKKNESQMRSLKGRLGRRLRQRMYQAIIASRGGRAGSAVRDLGCSVMEFRAHIEAQFQPGMTWGNWSPTGWHLDHKRPLAAFDLSDREQFLQACHYTNYQPLWASENLAKGAKI